MNSDNYLNLLDRIDELECKVKKFERLIEFHKLDNIPLKYRKAFPKENESLTFTLDQFKSDIPQVQQLGYGRLDPTEIILPKDLKEIDDAKERMRKYLHQSKTIPNPNLLSEKLKKEHDYQLIRFKDKWPTQEDFPIYKYIKNIGKLEKIETHENLGIMPKQWCIDPEIYWFRVFIGD